MKVLFVSDYKHEVKDGLWAAINILGYDRYNIGDDIPNFEEYDFLLGHGAFHSQVDMLLRSLPNKKGLCIGGNVYPQDTDCYDVLFYETEWVKNFLNLKGNLVHAFGTNTFIYSENYDALRPIKYLSVGAFAKWKRHHLIKNKDELRLVVGEIQKDNMSESMEIVTDLLKNGVGIMPQQSSDNLDELYNLAQYVYIPADIYGGGERAVLEARSCGCKVEVEDDNPKLQELLTSLIWDEHYYASQLKKGIESCLNK